MSSPASLNLGQSQNGLTISYHISYNKILDWSIFKAVAEDEFDVFKVRDVTQMMGYINKRFEIIVGKGENAGYQKMLVSKSFYIRLVKKHC